MKVKISSIRKTCNKSDAIIIKLNKIPVKGDMVISSCKQIALNR